MNSLESVTTTAAFHAAAAAESVFGGQAPAATGHPFAPPRGNSRGGLRPRVRQRVRELMETNLAGGISIQALASAANLSLSHFARAFKQSEGITPHDFLIGCRVRRASRLLAETDEPLSSIAYSCGFADQSHFARQFREHVGVTPSRYRWSLR
jgi:AraC-like DNA-binding protein